MGKSAPKAPTPQAQAQAQLGTNVGTALANTLFSQTNQKTPYGSLSYAQTGSTKVKDPFTGKEFDIPQFTSTQTLSPQQQAILDAQQQGQQTLATAGANMAGKVANRNPFAFAANSLKAPSTDFSSDRFRVEDALMARMNPQIERDRAAMEARLANQGVRVGSDAYTRAQGDFGQQANDARYGAILNAGQEQSRLAGLDSQQFANQMSLQGFNDQRALTERNQPLNELASLQSGAQITQPNFMASGGVQMPTTDVAGLMQQGYQNQMQAYQQKQSNLGGLLGLGAQLFSLSDERAKGKMKPVGTLKGHALYEYHYKGDPTRTKHIGVSAQEVERKRPDVVAVGDDGLRRVNYGALFSAGGK